MATCRYIYLDIHIHKYRRTGMISTCHLILRWWSHFRVWRPHWNLIRMNIYICMCTYIYGRGGVGRDILCVCVHVYVYVRMFGCLREREGLWFCQLLAVWRYNDHLEIDCAREWQGLYCACSCPTQRFFSCTDFDQALRKSFWVDEVNDTHVFFMNIQCFIINRDSSMNVRVETVTA